MLFEQVTKILERHDFSWCECRGCFDIAARKHDLVLVKVLDNIDSLQESQASNLMVLSDKLDANVSVIGTHTRYGQLDDNVVYDRFDVPAFTPNTLDFILNSRNPLVYRNKGGHFIEIDPNALRNARVKSGLTQQKLADAVGITKKSVYEHESRRMHAQHDTVKRIEKILDEDISIPFENLPFENTVAAEPSAKFEKSIIYSMRKIGFSTSFISQSPFNIIAEEKVMIVSDAEKNPQRIERKAKQLEEFAGVSNKPLVVISETEPRTNLPSITVSQLRELSAKNLRKLAKK